MERVKQVAGGIVLGVMTVVVVVGAVYALWLGAPLLNPGGDRFSASDIPIINTDAKIVRPIPPAEVSPRAGVIQPAPSTIKPKATRVVRKASPKQRSVATVTRVASPSRSRAKPTYIEVARHSDSSEYSHRAETSDSEHKAETKIETKTD